MGPRRFSARAFFMRPKAICTGQRTSASLCKRSRLKDSQLDLARSCPILTRTEISTEGDQSNMNPLRNLASIAATAMLVASCADTPPSPTTTPTITSAEAVESSGERYLPREDGATNPNTLTLTAKSTMRRGGSAHPNVVFPRSSNIPKGVGVSQEMYFETENYSIVSASRRSTVADPLTVHVLNIGAGSCQIVECPDSTDIFIADCGSKRPSASDLSREEISTYLERNNLTGDIILTLSHPHEDHYNRVVALLGDRNPRSVWLGGKFEGYGGRGEDRIDNWITDLDNSGVPIYQGFEPHFANRGMPVQQLACGSAETYILTVNVGSDPNENSMMLLMEYGNFRIIFSGDAEGVTEDSAMNNFGALVADTSVLTSSHHGASSHESNDSDWATKTSPQVVIFSSGLSYKHPRKRVVQRYEESVFQDVNEHKMWWNPNKYGTTSTFDTTRALYATEVSGTILIETDGNEFDIRCIKGGTTEACF